MNHILDGGPIGELPENWDQTKDDTQSLFLNKSDKNDLEPYPLALSEEGNKWPHLSELYHVIDVAIKIYFLATYKRKHTYPTLFLCLNP